MGFPKSKKTFFKGNSKGKKAFPGKFAGYKQKKQTTSKGKKHVKQMTVKKPEQIKTQTSGTAPHKMQMYLKPKPVQPKFIPAKEDNITKRLRKLTG